jgi:zinc transport system ATP-binding protein
MAVQPVNDKQDRSLVALAFDKVAFSYGQVPVLEDVSFHIHQGEFIALVGPNGAGKTTVLKLVLGLEKPQRGSVTLFGGEPGAGLGLTGYVPQHAGYDPTFPISVREVVEMGRLLPLSRTWKKGDKTAVDEALERAEITDLASRPYSALSGGQRRRVLVARALASRPRLLILDEPTANMDTESEARLFATLGSLKRNTTILIVTHDTGFVSSLTDGVLCVGDRRSAGEAHTIVRHRVAPADNAPPELFGGEALKVLHEVSLPGDDCCGDKGHTHG